MLGLEQRTGFGGLYDNPVGIEPVVRGQREIVGERRVDAQKAVFADVAEAHNHDVRGEENVVAYYAAKADVIAALQYDIVADLHERLNRVVFEDEHMFAERHVVPRERAN
ncbi:hypothetical protein [Paraburkholderia sp. SOS3]|uniref:hypothetical protein n=1 Tax=Paraburkholderia sp. SOS3 TaxID=1926494 RepID=UPI002FBE86F5